MGTVTTEIFRKLTPEMKAAINRHPSRIVSSPAGMAVTAAQAQPAPRRGSRGKRERLRCLHCGGGIVCTDSNSAAEKALAAHRCGPVAITFECLLS